MKYDGIVYDYLEENGKVKEAIVTELVATKSKEMGLVNPVDLIVKVKKLAGEAGGMKKLKQLVDLMAE